MWTCWIFKQAIVAYQEHELGGWKTGSMAKHLRRCRRCQAELEQLRRVTQLLRSLPLGSRPPAYWPQAIARLDAKRREQPPVRPSSLWLEYGSGLLENPAQAMLPAVLLGTVLIATLAVFGLEEKAFTLFSAYLLPLVLD